MLRVRKKVGACFARLRKWAIRHSFELLSIAVTVAIGLWIPIAIDSGQVARAKVDVCTTGILNSRHDLDVLLRGYAIDRSDKPNRLADWDTALSSLEIVHVTCDSSLVSGGSLLKEHPPTNFETLFAHFVHTRNLDRTGEWTDEDRGIVEAMNAWTESAVANLASIP